MICTVDKCERYTEYNRQLCQPHGALKWKYGTPTPTRICVECGISFVYLSAKINGTANIVKGNPVFANCDKCFKLKMKLPRGVRMVVQHHGMTIHNFIELYKIEKGQCALCSLDVGKPYVWQGKSGLWIDHDHSCCYKTRGSSCGKCIRGLLCCTCNFIIGYYEANPRLKVEIFDTYLSRTPVEFSLPTRNEILNG